MSREHSSLLYQLRSNAFSSLGLDPGKYDSVFVIYGKFGGVDPNENDKNLIYSCVNLIGNIGGYSNLEFAENELKKNGVLDCRKFWGRVHYSAPGWQIIVHEILHRFGAIDIYDTGTVFGIKSEREKALETDPNADQSVMGNRKRVCINQEACTKEELDFLYLDKYNKELMGIWD